MPPRSAEPKYTAPGGLLPPIILTHEQSRFPLGISEGHNFPGCLVDAILPLCGSRSSALVNIPVVKYLISRKAQLNVVGSLRGGPLHYASWASTLERVKVLVAPSADINLVDGSRQLSAELRGAGSQHSWEHAGLYSQLNLSRVPVEFVTALLEKGARIEQPDVQGHTAMHMAADKVSAKLSVNCSRIRIAFDFGANG
ncbi:ankyrin repeat domain-containing protein [Aspergillus saccharolyticus JOP 1030-1]|uniref:Uncharacterized protein n=1 Tax=Aspergillus saccharolyticus JOP 1030-1 TaxID=1450539 RepID=A0A318ZHM0_9EURO|nr:hypothetical protein BP01DRAFT_380913 [Aspergillus saccharolyticus JOP 1030-1]PYH47071.1 hypothetical protein BP01DRAFT_380913 [Aspergillus saccharolyticus JOP 1030-1]